jgi:hypothetical protein
MKAKKTMSHKLGRLKDLSGMKFGRWKIKSFHSKDKWGNHLWMAECACGTESIVRGKDAIRGATISCGCYLSEVSKRTFTTHGLTRSTEYNSWRAMKARCHDPKSVQFKDYGGRGITIQGPWVNSFEEFLSYMGPKPSNNHSIDRYPDKNGNYEPGNVRWATAKEQGNNTRRNHLVTFDGRTQTIDQWSRETGINYGTLRSRLRIGWTDAAAITGIKELRHLVN